MGYHVTLKTGRFLTQILLMRSVRLWDLTSLQDTKLRVTFGWYLKYCCDKRLLREVASLSVTQIWPQGSQMVDKKILNKLCILFQCLYRRFWQASKYPL